MAATALLLAGLAGCPAGAEATSPRLRSSPESVVPAEGPGLSRPLDGAGFSAAVTGLTLDWQSGGEPYGTEQYLPGRRVIWQFEGGPCRAGIWFPAESNRICFVYDEAPGEVQCWQFEAGPSGLSAVFRGEGGPGRRLSAETGRPGRLICPEAGPGV